jgi:hypothetical protein
MLAALAYWSGAFRVVNLALKYPTRHETLTGENPIKLFTAVIYGFS